MRTEKTGISVIMPTYNRADIIERAINSVLVQTYEKLEIIIVDDASADGTEAVVGRMEDRRIRYHRLKENAGPSQARNIGVKMAVYPFIAFADSDDIWHEKKLEEQMGMLQDDVGLVFCAFELCMDKVRMQIPSARYKSSDLSGNIFESLLRENKIGTPTILMRKDVFWKAGGFHASLKSFEDWEFVLRAARCCKIAYMDKRLVRASFSRDGVNQRYLDQVHTIFYIMNLYREEPGIERKTELLLSRLAMVKDSDQISFWRERLVPQWICSESWFDRLFSMAKEKEAKKLSLNIITELCMEEKLMRFIGKYLREDHGTAIYGGGDVGRSLYYRLSEKNIHVPYIIDRNHIVIENAVWLSLDELKGTDIRCVLVTLPLEFEEICKAVRERKEVRCINIQDLLSV